MFKEIMAGFVKIVFIYKHNYLNAEYNLLFILVSMLSVVFDNCIDFKYIVYYILQLY